MIDKEQFRENFRPFDNEIVVEIIDIFTTEYPDRMSELEKNIQEEDFESLRFNAHSLKGVIANFLAPEPKSYAKELEERGKNKIIDGSTDYFIKLKTSTAKLVEDLKELRSEYI